MNFQKIKITKKVILLWVICSSSWGTLYGLKNNISVKTDLQKQLQIKQLIEQTNFDSALLLVDLYLKEKKDLPLTSKDAFYFDDLVTGYMFKSAILLEKDKLKEGKDVIDKAFKIAKSKLGGHHFLTANILHNLGKYYWKKYDYDNGIIYFEQALKIKEKIVPIDDSSVGQTMACLGYMYMRKREMKKAHYFYAEAIRLFNRNKETNHLNLADVYNYLGITSFTEAKYDEVIPYYNISKRYIQQSIGHNNARMAKVINNTGNMYALKKQWKEALECFNESVSIAITKNGEISNKVAETYLNIGGCYVEMHRYDQALDFFNKAMNIQLKLPTINESTFSKINYAIGTTYLELGQFEKALTILLEVLEKEKILNYKRNRIGDVCRSIGIVYQKMGDHVKAKEYFLIALNNEAPNSYDEAINFSHLGNLYKANKQYKNSIEYTEKAKALRINLFSEHHPLVIENNNAIGEVYFARGNYLKALDYYQESLNRLVPTFKDTSILKNPEVKEFYALNELVATLSLKAQALYALYQQKKEQSSLKATIATYSYIDELLDVLRTNIISENDKLTLSEVSKIVYEYAINALYEAWEIDKRETYLKKAFEYSEKSKAFALLEAKMKAFALDNVGIPDSLKRKERTINSNLVIFKRNLFKEMQKGIAMDSAKVIQFRDKIFASKKQKNQLLNRLTKQYPKYFQARFGFKVTSIEKIQDQLLHEDNALIAYTLGENFLFIFGLTKKKYAFFRVPITPIFKEQLASYQQFISTPSKGVLQFADKDYIKLATHLYNTLLLPVQQFISGNRRLIIIPDEELGYLPFESLLVSVPKEERSYRDLDYLLYHHTLTYGSSATLLEKGLIKQGKPSKLIASFAPQYGINNASITSVASTIRNNALSPLKYNQEEARQVVDICGGDDFIGKEVYKNTFQTIAGDYQVLHLAMHGIANEKNPEYAYLAFSADESSGKDPFLYAYELYNMKLNADLTVLSACKTGGGKLAKGEGIMSLSRAFKYSGCKNIIMSLWSVDDRSSKNLMYQFFASLKEGDAQGEALRKAKIDLVKNAPSDEFAHPFFWANFMLIGNNTSVDFTGNNILRQFGLVFSIVFMGLIFVVHRQLN